MRQYISQRLLLAIPTLLGVAVLIFVLMRVMPGDIATQMLEYVQVNDPAVAALREELGLNKPLPVQLGAWLRDVATLDFGTSMRHKVPVRTMIAERLPVTIQLALMATVIAGVVAITGGIISAIKQDTSIDYLLRVVSIMGLAIPSFWLGMVIVLALVLLFDWIPPLEYFTPFEDLGKNFQVTIFPALALGYRSAAVLMRMTRSTMLEVLREDYIRTARAKGLRERTVVYAHATKNVLLPVITVLSLELSFLLGGAVVIELVFNLPGLGSLLVESVQIRDYPVVQGIVLLIGFIVVLTNLVVDVLYGVVDPRVRYS